MPGYFRRAARAAGLIAMAAFAPLMAGFPADPEELACLARLVRADARRDTCTSRS
jgi:hypothetical protein